MSFMLASGLLVVLAPVGLGLGESGPSVLAPDGTRHEERPNVDPCGACSYELGCAAACQKIGQAGGYCAWPGSRSPGKCCECEGPGATPAVGELPVAVFLQFGSVSSTLTVDDMLACTDTVAQAINAIGTTSHAYASFHHDTDPAVTTRIMGRLSQQQFARVIGQENVADLGMDVGSFIGQIETAQQVAPNGYSLALKLHSKTADEWRQHALESLCGSTAHVQAIVAKFSDPTVGNWGWWRRWDWPSGHPRHTRSSAQSCLRG